LVNNTEQLRLISERAAPRKFFRWGYLHTMEFSLRHFSNAPGAHMLSSLMISAAASITYMMEILNEKGVFFSLNPSQ